MNSIIYNIKSIYTFCRCWLFF